MHRLDQFVSGVMVLGKNIFYARTFGSMMEQKKIYKAYYALWQGFPEFIKYGKVKSKPENQDQFLSGMIRSDDYWTGK